METITKKIDFSNIEDIKISIPVGYVDPTAIILELYDGDEKYNLLDTDNIIIYGTYREKGRLRPTTRETQIIYNAASNPDDKRNMVIMGMRAIMTQASIYIDCILEVTRSGQIKEYPFLIDVSEE